MRPLLENGNYVCIYKDRWLLVRVAVYRGAIVYLCNYMYIPYTHIYVHVGYISIFLTGSYVYSLVCISRPISS